MPPPPTATSRLCGPAWRSSRSRRKPERAWSAGEPPSCPAAPRASPIAAPHRTPPDPGTADGTGSLSTIAHGGLPNALADQPPVPPAVAATRLQWPIGFGPSEHSPGEAHIVTMPIRITRLEGIIFGAVVLT